MVEDDRGISVRYPSRATVYGLWIDKEPFRVSSGYITKDTKVRVDGTNVFKWDYIPSSRLSFVR